MYCKYCGKMLREEETICSSCGNRINLLDGGQSFFTEQELDMWREPEPAVKNRSTLPKTRYDIEEEQKWFEEGQPVKPLLVSYTKAKEADGLTSMPQDAVGANEGRKYIERKEKLETIVPSLSVQASQKPPSGNRSRRAKRGRGGKRIELVEMSHANWVILLFIVLALIAVMVVVWIIKGNSEDRKTDLPTEKDTAQVLVLERGEAGTQEH